MTLDEKLQNFYQSAMEDATSQRLEIINEFKISLDKIYKNHKEDALRRAKLTLQTESDNCIRIKNSVLSTEAVNIKKITNDKITELTDVLFSDVEKKLEEYMNTPEYTQLLCNQIKEALKFSRGDQMIIYINPSDAGKKAELEKLTNAALTVSATEFIGGTRAVIHSKNILIDNSFLTRLSEVKEEFKLK